MHFHIGFHFTQSYTTGCITSLVLANNFDSRTYTPLSLIVTSKLLQALVEGISIITPEYIHALLSNSSSLSLPDPALYRIMRLVITSFHPTQDGYQFDMSPNPFRKTVFSSYVFHFVTPESPYASIVSLASGQLDTSSSPFPPSCPSVIVFRDSATSGSSLSVDTASLVMNRELPEEVLKWVQRGWIPMEEQEIMRSLLYEGEFQTLLKMNENRGAEERARCIDVEEDTKSESSAVVVSSPESSEMLLKRPCEESRIEDDVEDFFLEVSQKQQLQAQRIESQRREVYSVASTPSKRVCVEERREEEVVKEIPVAASVQVVPGKGKNFRKNSVKRVSVITPLLPYRGLCVC